MAFSLGIIPNAIAAISSIDRVKYNGEIYKPRSKISVIAPGWREPDEYLEKSLSSIVNQNVIRKYPDYFELIFIGCSGINLDIPIKYGFKIICTYKGKLTARHIAILNSEGDIIVSVDCDTYYPPNWLNLLLQPYEKYSDAVATTCNTWQGILDLFIHGLVVLAYTLKISGRGSTFLKEAYFKVGGFDLNIDQNDVNELLREEEYRFRYRLEKIGRVITVDAPVFHLGGRESYRGIRVKEEY